MDEEERVLIIEVMTLILYKMVRVIGVEIYFSIFKDLFYS
jgi:hypothetical protein